ncbi:MAG: carbohydrate ABC transporter permease [Firmicutes bacterium]|jgi:ABC-type glycerol-3-phosphate transport system permease component|nr:carbohydrate ABC transporter permease [Bacillota bacterium]
MSKFIAYGLRALVAAAMAAPIYWVFVIATGYHGAAYSIPPVWRPLFHWAPFLFVWTHTPWARYVLNSVVISASTIILVVVTSALAGYALAELKFPGNSMYFYVTLGVMMLPQQALLVPQYVVMYHLHLLNTYTGLIIPFAASTSGIFLFRQFFMKLPVSYREIARLEGVSTLTYLRRVAVPLARPAVATTVLLTFISSWNQFQWPLIMTVSSQLQPIELALSHYMQAYQSHWRELTAAALIALLPILIVFALTQRHIVSAVAGGEVTQKD